MFKKTDYFSLQHLLVFIDANIRQGNKIISWREMKEMLTECETKFLGAKGESPK